MDGDRQLTSNVFTISLVQDCNGPRPHYPKYRTRTSGLGVATSLVEAEKIVRSAVGWRNNHHFVIREIVCNAMSLEDEYLSEYLYGPDGTLIDESKVPSYLESEEPFGGRSPEQIRFSVGDIVEVAGEDEIHLAVVVSFPPSLEKAEKFNTHMAPFFLDFGDDSYVVITEEDYRSHEHVSALRVFRPMFRIHPAVERRLRTAYQNFYTRETREEILYVTAREKILETAEALGIRCAVSCRDGRFVQVDVEDFPTKGKREHLEIDRDRALYHIGRVCITLSRLAGRPTDGRGYVWRRYEPINADPDTTYLRI